MSRNPWTRWDRALERRLGIHVLVAHAVRKAIERAGYDEIEAEALPWDDARDAISDARPERHTELVLDALHLEVLDRADRWDSPAHISAWLAANPAPQGASA